MISVIVISTFYFFFVGLLTFGWLKLKSYKKNNNKNNNSSKTSIIIAFRNEEKNLPFIVEDIANQNYPKNYFEVIFVNDHSEDNSVKILEELIKEKNNFRILELNNYKGKKQALKHGINNSTGDLIVTTDADCRMQKKWLSTICNYYSSIDAKMIVCPVLYTTKKPLLSFGNFQALEFLSLTASTIGSIGINKPLMCNGANLAFEKKTFQKFSNPTKEEIPSGDDTFLLFNINKKYHRKVKYLKNKHAIVTTKPAKNLSVFFNQRIRWASKTKYYKQFFVLFSGFVTITIY
ncbi:MAG: glycosyltransferase, partial [Bacteroidota bacterium]|nr:glycosyltransferase [Bacteroidota bacterium]